MAKAILTLLFLLSSYFSAGSLTLVDGQKTWCVARPSSDEMALEQNIVFAYKYVNCNIFNEGGPCFSPDNSMNHASIAMNLYYQSKGRNFWNCNFGNSGLVVLTDPSYGGCIYG
ncbi:glucan endo-1,3-beta-glucosidase-like [Solanum stenotomum]|uniref:glucan endo-1,3-beta-glucosidase-like n=1 Tax=Solanum stenotomum TaxID=172797 RepID=UPI0020D02C83|nr:glucan endo-1,3-beta-glucosidase-like [Solanum stenotomum]